MFLQPGFERLEAAAAPGAFHNSGERFDPPRCHPNTRVAVQEKLLRWIFGTEESNAIIMWLRGAAGAGKSAIAQTIAEYCFARGILLASFFFSRSDPSRNHGNALFSTIAYQLACIFPEARAHLEITIDRDPLIFKKSLQVQMNSLIVEPLQELVNAGHFIDPATSPHLIIIDGLDECHDIKVQCKILEVMADTLRQSRLPLIFLIASRPEQHIAFTFESPKLDTLHSRLSLDASFKPDEDIQLYLNDSFEEIKSTHPRKKFLTDEWPSSEVVQTLVQKSSGQFIYASTVINYVKSIRHLPNKRLEIVLNLLSAQNDMPFAELDALYMHIFSNVENVEAALPIIAFVLLGDTSGYVDYVEMVLDLQPADVEVILSDLSALVVLDEENPGSPTIRVLHASLADFLFDASRSEQFYIHPMSMHTSFACRLLVLMNTQNVSGGHFLLLESGRGVLTHHPLIESNSRNVIDKTRQVYNSTLHHLELAQLTPQLRNDILQLSLESCCHKITSWNNFQHYLDGFVFLWMETFFIRLKDLVCTLPQAHILMPTDSLPGH